MPIKQSTRRGHPSAPKKGINKRPSTGSKAKNRAAKAERAQLRYEAELKRVGDQRKAGFDPSIGMDFLPKYLKLSRATIYKKIGKEFPLPVKHGRLVRWKLSQADAYNEVSDV